MKVLKLLVMLVVVLVLAVGINAVVTKNPKSPQKANTINSPERDREAGIREKLASLLSSEGVRVDAPLTTESHAYRELRVRWQSSTSAGSNELLKQSGPGNITLFAAARKEGILPRDRSLELSPNQILMIAVDGKSALRWWKLMLDPRLIRSETTASTGELKGEDHYLAAVDFIINYPDDPEIKEVRLYHPRWTGKDFQLELLSTLPIK